ncbi:GRAM domain-containing protein 2A isoform X2 [Scophthalmus maximus]|uniref:GRAM domain-containing protein 2A isoform X2 n=1 Tax=Scophthalmus maximus TaxID=52904 RepID=UPI0015E0AC54|nr:GRAM domain-containing protein 2A isoform X2 [Scophthalmus maximus]
MRTSEGRFPFFRPIRALPPPHLQQLIDRTKSVMMMMSENLEQIDDISAPPPHELEPPREEDAHCPLPFRLQLIDDLSYEDVKKCYRGSTVSKYNSQYHKLFQTVPPEEILMKVYSCALLRDILLQGRLYISRNWLCFYANLFGKDIKVCIPVVSVRLVKKHKTAGLVPNGLAITMDTGQKYVFVSLLSRDSVYDVLRRICTHLQVNGKSLSLKQYLEEPSSLSMDEFPEVLKWRRKPSLPIVSSSLPDLLGTSSPSLVPDEPFSTHTLTDSSLETEKILLTEPVPELGQVEYQLLKLFILLVFLLVLSSCYLAFRVCRLEQQLSFLSSQPTLRERCGEVPCWLANQRTGT